MTSPKHTLVRLVVKAMQCEWQVLDGCQGLLGMSSRVAVLRTGKTTCSVCPALLETACLSFSAYPLTLLLIGWVVLLGGLGSWPQPMDSRLDENMSCLPWGLLCWNKVSPLNQEWPRSPSLTFPKRGLPPFWWTNKTVCYCGPCSLPWRLSTMKGYETLQKVCSCGINSWIILNLKLSDISCLS